MDDDGGGVDDGVDDDEDDDEDDNEGRLHGGSAQGGDCSGASPDTGIGKSQVRKYHHHLTSS